MNPGALGPAVGSPRWIPTALLAVFAGLALWFALDPAPTRLDAAANGALDRLNPEARLQWGDSALEEGLDYVLFGLADLALVLVAWRLAALRLAVALGLSLVAHESVVLAVQALVARPRPPGAWESHGAYPSGHAANFALTILLFVLVVLPLARARRDRPPRRRDDALLATLLILAFAAFRLQSQEHWATDVLGALALGTAWALATRELVRPLVASAAVGAKPPTLKPGAPVRRP